jgi:Planctomycete cytochrome C/Anaphase-promoting complex subunit 4 WD40 domain/WD domain, G-beta repeat
MRKRGVLRFSSLLFFVTVGGACAAEVAPSYEEQIKPIFREHCLKCHGEDEQKADLNLSSFGSLSKGGSGGSAVTPGRASTSLLFKAITAEDDAERMPPKKAPIPAAQINLIKAWIEAGTPERTGGKSLVAARDTAFKPVIAQRSDGPGPMPEQWPPVAVPAVVNPQPVFALAASPTAPIYAVPDLNAVRVHGFSGDQLLGVVPFPEGQPNVLRFSQDGSLLLVAGGQPVNYGVAVLVDVRSGKRLASVGDESDAVLAADLSPDQKLVALGGSGKTVKVFSTETGKPVFKLSKHTDWITAVAFSPDGKKLATADRAGGLHLWETGTGQILLTLAEHKGAIRALAWRGDGRLLASAGDDGLLIRWDAADGWPVSNNANAHQPKRPAGYYGKLPGGVLSLAFSQKGEMVSTGRDRLVKMWGAEGQEIRSRAWEQLPLQCAFSADGATFVVGDARGGVVVQKVSP